MAEIRWKKFNAMGTEVIVSAFLESEEENLLERAEKIILDFEKRFSRFIVGNELYKLNNFNGNEFEASDMMAELLAEAKKMNKETGGVFDPTIIGSLETVGYDKNFIDIENDGKASNQVDVKKIKQDFLDRGQIKDINISGRKVFVPKGLRVDFGGIGKGYIVDFLIKSVFKDMKNFWISAGGDLFVKGSDQGKIGWKIGVQDPTEPEREIFYINTKGREMGIATSGIFKRKGIKGGNAWHHLIDPRSGLPVENNILAVTAISSSAQKADVFAKTVLIMGEKEGVDFIEKQRDSVCLVFLKDKGLMFSQGALDYF